MNDNDNENFRMNSVTIGGNWLLSYVIDFFWDRDPTENFSINSH